MTPPPPPAVTTLTRPLPSPQAENDTAAWRTTLETYYRTNAPEKLAMVNDKMMEKFSGKYVTLYTNLQKKYGKLGAPITPPPPALGARRPAAPRGASTGKKSVADYSGEFAAMVAEAASRVKPSAPSEREDIDSKTALAANGLETSTFTVCARVRPVLPHEAARGGENFAVIVKGNPKRNAATGVSAETAVLLKPKVTMTGAPKLDAQQFAFDQFFDAQSDDDEIFDAVGRRLVRRALDGQVGVVFAYGQTGSGKTHTMSALMERVTDELFRTGGSEREIRFSYMELLGPDATDCLAPGNKDRKARQVAIGEALDGSVLTKNLTEHSVADIRTMGELVSKANSMRSTAATERNDESSRSHGVGVVRVSPAPGCTLEGTLFVIDLAGSERTADSKDHSKGRLAETKQINLSLMALKECIRARTAASKPGAAHTTHVPYRRSKLTMLMKDVFDITSPRLCSTVVLAAVSPLARDVSHSANTLGYAAPLRVAIATAKGVKLEVDVRDPALWGADAIAEWVAESIKIDLGTAAAVVGGIAGNQFCALSEPDLFNRCTTAGVKPGDANRLYKALWAAVVDAKSRKRKPDGRLLTAADEAREAAAAEKDRQEKAAIWAEREKSLRTAF